MAESLVLRIVVDLAQSDRGGRRRALTDGYRASLSFGRRRRDVEPVVHDAVLVLEDAAELSPGGSATARACSSCSSIRRRFRCGTSPRRGRARSSRDQPDWILWTREAEVGWM